MSSGKGIADFPNVEAKLQKPTKQSAFERQKAEAEAKRKREAAETAAVYADFVKSFDRDDDDDDTPTDRPSHSESMRGGRSAFGGGHPPGHGASKRHFVSSGLKSGPGSLGPAPLAFGKKRSFNEFRGTRDRSASGVREPGSTSNNTSVAKAFDASDDEDADDTRDREEEKAIAKPTLRLTNMPPGTSPAVVKALMPDNLNVENVKILAPVGSGGLERKCTVAIVTLSKETPGTEMDTTVSALQNRYLGYGYYLSLHRHLSSAVAASAALPTMPMSSSGTHPFGAKPVEQPSDREKHGHRPPGFHRGFAPPTSYGPAGAGINRSDLLQVSVKPPQDIRTIQLINKAIEGVLENGPEFEALLMSRPEVQREERWAWIWDARSEGGIWYRWRLWQVVTGSETSQGKGKYYPLFDGGHAWKSPEKSLVFEYTTSLDEFVSDPEYNSSDDEDMDGDGHGDNGPDTEKTFLNPLDKAKLVHLLARLPDNLSRLRKGDIARVSTFAITHASRGADEVVDMIVTNVEKPLSLTAANLGKKQESKASQPATGTDEGITTEGSDTSSASLVGLYVVSDILSSSSTSGVRHAWRFRQIFETALRERKVFERLGMLAERNGWGRLRAEKWKRSISLILNLWEGWCVFPAESQELFVRTFESPPSAKKEDKVDESADLGARRKLVEALPASKKEESAIGTVTNEQPQDDIDGEPLDEDDVMGERIDDDDVEGDPIDEDEVGGDLTSEREGFGGTAMEQDEGAGNSTADRQSSPTVKSQGEVETGGGGELAGRPQRKRMRAVDMFADSDGSDNER